eukprot:TRINITY_DN12808_c0_g1_i2.p1 TRINITY_DN12808_c0_g1~~TRINITY_DN12808_c0_g1_i2.p1  ORF type:complete len:301 (-),score=48.79 TRINITY_DN12808_c0_g1_i2:13-789(-)
MLRSLVGSEMCIRDSLLNRYWTNTSQPRPESFREDVNTTKAVLPALVPQLYADIAAAAESGWDFSTRWMNLSESDPLGLEQLVTSRIIPVDLNAIILRMERTLALFHEMLSGSPESADRAAQDLLNAAAWTPDRKWTCAAAEKYADAAEARLLAITQLLWQESMGCWNDYRLDLGTAPTRPALISDYIPMWAGVLDGASQAEQLRVCLLYTSDAADEEDSVDLGGRRIIKKKKNSNRTRYKVNVESRNSIKNIYEMTT